MSHPDHARWQQCWRDKGTRFHLTHVHPLLQRFWPQLALAPRDRVFVPLCGKSRDLAWLRALGHHVTGVELSPIAIRALFKESHLQPTRTRDERYTRWDHERLRIFCGDIFALNAADLAGTKALYDRAALTALPAELREPYVDHLAAILPADCRQLLLTIEDLDDNEDEASASGSSEEVTMLYGRHFGVDLRSATFHPAAYAADGSITEARSVHKAYLIGARIPG